MKTSVLQPAALPDQLPRFMDEASGVSLYQADCFAVMDALLARYPSGLFDVIFADPPYFLSNGGITCQNGRMVRVDKGDWDRSQGPELNHEFNREWLRRCQALLKPNGTIWVSGTHHVIYSVGFAMQQLDMKLLNHISWEKPNPPPNLSCRYFTHSTETIIWAAKNAKARHYFDYSAMRAQNGGKQMKSVWNIKPPSSAEKRFGKHPTQKPLALLQRILEASTQEGDWVLDPFAGSATTGVAAVAMKRQFVGIELESEHFKLAERRLAEAIEATKAIETAIETNGANEADGTNKSNEAATASETSPPSEPRPGLVDVGR